MEINSSFEAKDGNNSLHWENWVMAKEEVQQEWKSLFSPYVCPGQIKEQVSKKMPKKVAIDGYRFPRWLKPHLNQWATAGLKSCPFKAKDFSAASASRLDWKCQVIRLAPEIALNEIWGRRSPRHSLKGI